MRKSYHDGLVGGVLPALLMLVASGVVLADQPGDAHRWVFSPHAADGRFAADPGTPGGSVAGETMFGPASRGGGLLLDGETNEVVMLDRIGSAPGSLPTRELTVAAWVSVESPKDWGGIVGAVEDTGDFEKGWVLGYNRRSFTFGLSTKAADDGNGMMTYVASDEPYTIGRWHHVAAVYDGSRCELYVDGRLAGSTDAQSGDILYHPSSPFVIGAYHDSNERHLHDGRILEVSVMPHAMGAREVAELYRARRDLGELDPWTDRLDGWVVEPFLTWPTEKAVSIGFEFESSAQAAVEYWRDSGDDPKRVESSSPKTLHNLRLNDLEPNAKYFYRIARTDAEGVERTSDLFSFETARTPDRAFTFVVIGDTQAQPSVVKRVSDLAFMHRPGLVILAGDLVSTGRNKSHWTGHFFPNMQPLIGRVPLVPVLGNHEQNADHYYDYMDLPAPEYYYSLRYGNGEFFLLDSNKSLTPGSEQHEWLDRSLGASDATWKFVVLHHPPYTSDSDDYGDTFKGPSGRGDGNAKAIIPVLERHGVDMCFSGHVHDYERTFPIRDGRTVSYEDGGVIYVTAAGGGGHLENFDPTNTWFGHKKAQVHHLVYVAINGTELEMHAVDERGRLFDVLLLEKRPGRSASVGDSHHAPGGR